MCMISTESDISSNDEIAGSEIASESAVSRAHDVSSGEIDVAIDDSSNHAHLRDSQSRGVSQHPLLPLVWDAVGGPMHASE